MQVQSKDNYDRCYGSICFEKEGTIYVEKPLSAHDRRDQQHLFAAFRDLPLGAIQPLGWLREQLSLQRDGLTGHLEEIWPDVGPENAWRGGNGDDWERGPYYCDGLVPLAYLLHDENLMRKAQHWIEWTLQSQRADGQFGPTTDEDWWPRMIMLKVLIQYYRATQDARVIPFMTRYCRYQLHMLSERPLDDWAQVRGNENVLSIHWLYEQTHEPFLLELILLLQAQTYDWERYFAAFPLKERQATEARTHATHVVNVAMGLKTSAILYAQDGDIAHLQATKDALAQLMRYHGQMQGMFSGDEYLAGIDPAQGVELCGVVEYMFSLEQMIRIFGEGQFADTLEMVAYNALATTLTADMRAHQYDQQPNQVLCTIAPRNWTYNGDASNTFGLEPHYGCCTANLHQGWPKFAQSLWMKTDDDGVAAIAYAPCRVTTTVAGETPVSIEERTTYPFEENVELILHVALPTHFPVRLRIPAWCNDPSVKVNGEVLSSYTIEHGFICIAREWREGDTIELLLSMQPRLLRRSDGRGGVGVALGPLVFALEIGEAWTRIPGTPAFGDWEVRPTTAWNYALMLAPEQPVVDFRVERASLSTPPFSHQQKAVRIYTHGQRIPEWTLVDNSAGPLPERLLQASTPVEPLTLLPYGCARLRIAEFPYLTKRTELFS